MNLREYFQSDNSFSDIVPKNISKPIISGHEYKKLCKWNLCSRYIIDFDVEKVSEGDFVFLQGDTQSLREYSFLLWENGFLSEFNKPLNFIVHNTDESFNIEDFVILEPYALNIWTINNMVDEDKVHSIPLGFNDHSAGYVDKLDWEYYYTNGVWEKEKHRLCLVKFWRNAMRPGRSETFRYFYSNTNWADLRTEEDWLPVPLHYEELKMYKYQICPTGAGLDTHRFWESILFDVIPIIKRNYLSDFLLNFPVLLVDDWSELNEKTLEREYESLYSELKTWKEENPNWLFVKNYIK